MKTAMPYKAGILQAPSDNMNGKNGMAMESPRQYASSLEVAENRDSRSRMVDEKHHPTDMNFFAKNAQQTLSKKP